MSETNTDNRRMMDAARAASTGKSSLTGYARLVFFMLRKMRGPVLQVQLPDGAVHEFAGDDKSTPPIVLSINNMSFFKTIVRRGSLGFAEAYMHEDWRSPDIARMRCFFNQNKQMIKQEIDNKRVFSFINRLIHKWRPNSRAGAKRNIHAHYDLGNNFYSLWLDKSMTYSSALFKDSQTDLRAAQAEKYRALAEAIDLQPDQHVLEIGCGWGGFAEFAAREIGCRVTGITISEEQLKFARTRIANAGLQDKVDFQFLDYRDVTQTYDRVV
ncbi:MAG: class I SAM-dependent methyltransferase, partial [Rhodobiaceae bacterium]